MPLGEGHVDVVVVGREEAAQLRTSDRKAAFTMPPAPIKWMNLGIEYQMENTNNPTNIGLSCISNRSFIRRRSAENSSFFVQLYSEQRIKYM